MLDSMCDLPTYWQAIIFIAFLLIESWLGLNTRIKSASTLELFLRSMWSMIMKMSGKPPEIKQQGEEKDERTSIY